jgi:hypothetical protein
VTSPAPARRRPEGRYDPPSRLPARLLAVLLTLLLLSFVAAVGNLIYRSTGGEDVEARVLTFSAQGDDMRMELEVRKPAGSRAFCVVRSRTREGVEVGREVVVVDAVGTAEDTVRVTHVLATSGRPATAEAGRCSASPISLPVPGVTPEP